MIPRPWLKEFVLDELRPLVPVDLPPLIQPINHDEVRRIARAENGDQLIRLPDSLQQNHIYSRLESITMPRDMYARASVVKRLEEAQKQLPEGLDLLILDTWRTLAFQEELGEIYLDEDPELRPGSVASTSDTDIDPPHTTGGAVDLTLSYKGIGLPLGTDFDSFDDLAESNYFESIPPEADPYQLLIRDLRRLLSMVLIQQEFAPYLQEWWHFSYGDQRWAAQYGHSSSLFSMIRQ